MSKINTSPEALRALADASTTLKCDIPRMAEALRAVADEKDDWAEQTFQRFVEKETQAAPVHWRAVLDAEQVPQQLQSSLHVIGFSDKRSAEGFIAEQLDFKGWRYTLEPLYAAPQPPEGPKT